MSVVSYALHSCCIDQARHTVSIRYQQTCNKLLLVIYCFRHEKFIVKMSVVGYALLSHGPITMPHLYPRYKQTCDILLPVIYIFRHDLFIDSQHFWAGVFENQLGDKRCFCRIGWKILYLEHPLLFCWT